MRLLRAAAASTPNGHAFRRHRLFTTSPSTYTPLLRIENAIIPGLQHRDPPHTFSWTINDAGAREAWAVTGPAAERGGAVKAEIVRVSKWRRRQVVVSFLFIISHRFPWRFPLQALMGQTRLQQQTNATSEPTRHPKVHPLQITIDDDRSQPPTSRSPTFSLVSFSSRLSSISGGPASSPSSFVDFSTRYGAIRDEDRITLYESIMEAMGTKTGLIARRDLVHDPLVDGDVEAERDYAEGTLRLPWTSEAIEAATRRAAKLNHQRVLELAPLLRLNEGDPPLLHQPLISLSNGQTRRARILSALCASPDVLVLEEPFTGLDPPSRAFLSQLLAEWHGKKTPRIVCVLREQDELPDFVTHILKIGEQGEVLWQGEKRRDARLSSSSPPALTGAALVRQQASDPSAPGRGDESAVPVAALNNVTVAYKGHEVLKVSVQRAEPQLDSDQSLTSFLTLFAAAVRLFGPTARLAYNPGRRQRIGENNAAVPPHRLASAILFIRRTDLVAVWPSTLGVLECDAALALADRPAIPRVGQCLSAKGH